MKLAATRLPLAALFLASLLATPAGAENWPRFRGPTGQGVSAERGLPLKWGNGENLLWKAEVPGQGWSSPVVWGDRLFLTSTTENGASCHVLCFDANSGKLLWDKEVFKQEPKRKEEQNSHATPTPVTDGKHVYAFFSGGGAAALDFEGKVAWTNTEHSFYSKHGMGASPLLSGDVLVMPFDGSSPGDDPTLGWKKPWDGAFILGLDAATGQVRWKAKRGASRVAHVTPQLTEVGGKPLLVSGAGDVIQGFDPATGDLLWTVQSQGEGVVPSVVVGEGLAFTSSGFEASTVRTVRLAADAKGDVTRTHVAWEHKRAVPCIPSFVYADGLLFSVKENGIALCMDAKTGEIVWQDRLDGTYSASPVLAEGRLYCLSETGETTVIAAGREFKELARNALDAGRCQASPAVSNGKIYVRGTKGLFCVGKGPATAG